jgi:hypothetical protein
MIRCTDGARALALVAVVPILAVAGLPAADTKTPLGVYEYVVEQAQGGFGAVSAAVESAITAGGWQLVGKVEVGAPKGCSFKSTVFAVVEQGYAGRLMAANKRTAPFAAVDRINVFQDEAGVHVAVVNVESVNRTVLMDDRAQADLSREHLKALRALVAGAVTGKASEREYGQRRDKGYIGKTMGVMAGGPFGEKVKDEFVITDRDWQATAEKVKLGLSARGPKWGLRLAYTLVLPEQETVVFGMTGSPMDSQSFSIVNAGGDETRSAYQCPGLDHAGAYPIEVVVTRDQNSVKVRMVDAMYRMKLFFEDAGKWAFMKNMGMPGSIHDELAAQIKAGLGMK